MNARSQQVSSASPAHTGWYVISGSADATTHVWTLSAGRTSSALSAVRVPLSASAASALAEAHALHPPPYSLGGGGLQLRGLLNGGGEAEAEASASVSVGVPQPPLLLPGAVTVVRALAHTPLVRYVTLRAVLLRCVCVAETSQTRVCVCVCVCVCVAGGGGLCQQPTPVRVGRGQWVCDRPIVSHAQRPRPHSALTRPTLTPTPRIGLGLGLGFG